MKTPRTPGPANATEEYGRRLVAHTAELLGPDQPDPSAALHRQPARTAARVISATGTEPGTLTLLQTDEHYPRFSGRAGTQTDIEDRINECMQRSMNGKPLPMDSPEMMAMAAYLRIAGRALLGDGRVAAEGRGAAALQDPGARRRASRPEATVFKARCAQCHGADGLGLLATTDRRKGYLFPPLWGPDSFNDGAGMHRVLTAARFIKARMPLGEADAHRR